MISVCRLFYKKSKRMKPTIQRLVRDSERMKLLIQQVLKQSTQLLLQVLFPMSCLRFSPIPKVPRLSLMVKKKD
ncbi:hypothetical protein SZ63_08745 [Methanoculleus sediminis]|uniref:Uncharacterized protein n=1 Tax=Methanoculleus sediminis TaxID=1550566 RepID=A0A0H1R4S2_9EURY|nr:hypothetical protein SZ63_08745 [Methanoculleus sediminis]